MSTSTPSSSEPTLDQRIRMTSTFHNFLHNTSLVMLVAAPALIAIPPRKLDLYTFFLTGSFIASANHLVKERTGAGILYQLPGARLPASAIEYQERIGLRQSGQRLLEEQARETAQRASVQENLARYGKLEGLQEKAKELWMGSEKEGWKEQRLAEEQRKLDEGEGYGGMIMDQIWEVWNWGEKKAEDLKEKDEQVVDQREDAKRKSEKRSRWEEEFPVIGKEG